MAKVGFTEEPVLLHKAVYCLGNSNQKVTRVLLRKKRNELRSKSFPPAAQNWPFSEVLGFQNASLHVLRSPSAYSPVTWSSKLPRSLPDSMDQTKACLFGFFFAQSSLLNNDRRGAYYKVGGQALSECQTDNSC